MFISFDGIDGAGKSTQIDQMVQWLEKQGHDVTLCRDPGSTELGEQLRQLLLQDANIPMHARSEMLLYMAARAQLVEQVIRPALAREQVVVSDRFLLANIVYQGYAGGLEIGDVRTVGEIAIAGIQPDCVLLLDLPPEAAVERLQRPFDRMESRGMEYLRRVREGFLAEAERNPHEIEVINANNSPEEVHNACRSAVRPLLKTPSS